MIVPKLCVVRHITFQKKLRKSIAEASEKVRNAAERMEKKLFLVCEQALH